MTAPKNVRVYNDRYFRNCISNSPEPPNIFHSYFIACAFILYKDPVYCPLSPVTHQLPFEIEGHRQGKKAISCSMRKYFIGRWEIVTFTFVSKLNKIISETSQFDGMRLALPFCTLTDFLHKMLLRCAISAMGLLYFRPNCAQLLHLFLS